jgi:hypothetical protein
MCVVRLNILQAKSVSFSIQKVVYIEFYRYGMHGTVPVLFGSAIHSTAEILFRRLFKSENAIYILNFVTMF